MGALDKVTLNSRGASAPSSFINPVDSLIEANNKIQKDQLLREELANKRADREYLLSERARQEAEKKAIEDFNIATNRPRQVEGGIVTDAYTAGKSFDQLQGMNQKDMTKEQRALVDLAFTKDEQKLYDEAKGDISKLTGEAKRKAMLQADLSTTASGYAQDPDKLESRWDQAKRVAGDNVKYTTVADRLKALEAADVVARKDQKEKAAKQLENATKYSDKYNEIAAKKAKAEKDWMKETDSIKKYTPSGGGTSTDLGDKVTFSDIEKVEKIVGKVAGKFDTGKGDTLQKAEKGAVALYKTLITAGVPKDLALQTVNDKVKGDEDWITDDELDVAELAKGELEKLKKQGVSLKRTVSPEVAEYDRQMKELLSKAEKAKDKADLLGLGRREQMLKDIRSGIKDPGMSKSSTFTGEDEVDLANKRFAELEKAWASNSVQPVTNIEEDSEGGSTITAEELEKMLKEEEYENSTKDMTPTEKRRFNRTVKRGEDFTFDRNSNFNDSLDYGNGPDYITEAKNAIKDWFTTSSQGGTRRSIRDRLGEQGAQKATDSANSTTKTNRELLAKSAKAFESVKLKDYVNDFYRLMTPEQQKAYGSVEDYIKYRAEIDAYNNALKDPVKLITGLR